MTWTSDAGFAPILSAKSSSATRHGTAGPPGRCRAEPGRRRWTAPACCRTPDAAASSTSGLATDVRRVARRRPGCRCGPGRHPDGADHRRLRRGEHPGTRTAPPARGPPPPGPRPPPPPPPPPPGRVPAPAPGPLRPAPPGPPRPGPGRRRAGGHVIGLGRGPPGRGPRPRTRTAVGHAGATRAGPAGAAPGTADHRDHRDRRPKGRDGLGRLTRRARALGPSRRRRIPCRSRSS